MHQESKPRLLLATRNPHKTREVREILGDAFVIEDLATLPDLPDVDETGLTFEENARLKAIAASHAYGGLVVADDSGLEVDALHGEPGVRSARYAGERATNGENRALLLCRMLGVPRDARCARFRCVLALARGGEVEGVFSGAVEGWIAEGENGSSGFGYDPLFVPEGQTRTFAEMSTDEKHAMSHRGRALAALAVHLKTKV